MEDYERALLMKLKKMTDKGELAWQFAGEAQKSCIALYRDARLKLSSTKLEIKDRDGDTVVLDALTSDVLDAEFENLLHAARKSAGNYPTGEIQAVNKNSIDLFKRLLQD